MRYNKFDVIELKNGNKAIIINKNNRRKYILTLTKEGEEVIPALKREADYWHNSVGFTEVSEETMDVIRTVARKSYNLVND